MKVNSWERNCLFILDLCGSSVIYSKQINKSTALLSLLRLGLFRFKYFSWTFTMALKLVHRCRSWKHNGCTMGGNLEEIKGINIIIRSLFYVTGEPNLGDLNNSIFMKMYDFQKTLFTLVEQLAELERVWHDFWNIYWLNQQKNPFIYSTFLCVRRTLLWLFPIKSCHTYLCNNLSKSRTVSVTDLGDVFSVRPV